MRLAIASVSALALLVTSTAVRSAAADTNDFREAPRGAGTETGMSRIGDPYRVNEGTELHGFAGVGYGVGIGGRLGYAFHSGVYGGGALTYFSQGATFLGGELGYKLFPSVHWELRPYLFAGPAFVRVGNEGFARSDAVTVLAVQPGFLAAYRFGPAFLSAEARAYLNPNPGALALLGGVGVAL